MKKFLTLALTAVMALSLLTACGSKNDNSADTNTDGSNNETTLSGTVSTAPPRWKRSSTLLANPSWP